MLKKTTHSPRPRQRGHFRSAICVPLDCTCVKQQVVTRKQRRPLSTCLVFSLCPPCPRKKDREKRGQGDSLGDARASQATGLARLSAGLAERETIFHHLYFALERSLDTTRVAGSSSRKTNQALQNGKRLYQACAGKDPYTEPFTSDDGPINMCMALNTSILGIHIPRLVTTLC